MEISTCTKESGLITSPASRLNLEPDDKIKAQLNTYAPVTSERNLWAFWDKGFNAMASWRQRNVINWVRREGKGWTVRVLDTMAGSPNHVNQYLDSSNIPAAVRDGRMQGRHAAQNTADIVRIAVLYQVSYSKIMLSSKSGLTQGTIARWSIHGRREHVDT